MEDDRGGKNEYRVRIECVCLNIQTWRLYSSDMQGQTQSDQHT